MKQKYVGLTGNEAVATAFRQARPHVAPAFPITPQTEMMHKFADFVADGRVDTEMVLVESEHSAMSAAIGSAATGARTFTATSSAGFALMEHRLRDQPAHAPGHGDEPFGSGGNLVEG